ncbi:MAG TPA: AMP-binding protein, partial [Thermoanaerobaculia bacterium]|nr:AMP-binding protein [Thermoanaerobaculia bacterium]
VRLAGAGDWQRGGQGGGSAHEGAEHGQPDPAREGDTLAYLLYTSGTTGRPKAVMVSQANLAHTLRSSQQAFGFQPGDRVPCLAAFSFDIFLLELLGPLLAGGTAVLYGLGVDLDLPRLASDLPSMTLLHAVPALMGQIVDELDRQGIRPAVRRAFVGGDAVPAELLARMREAFPGARITVLYGPTEATIITTFHEVDGRESRPLIGRPLPGSTVELRDRDGNLVPIGVPGEVWLGGPAVTRGYLHRPELTAEVFVPGTGGRFYRTGDLGRRLADGNVEFLGRTDHQVKVRGIRIEPGEIEAVLAAHPEVRAAAVLVRRSGEGDARLVACVVPRTGAAGDLPDELRQWLRVRLPEAMVPAGWAVLDALPLTPHGKVDRRALASAEAEEPVGGAAWAAPRTPTEELLAGLWAGLLGRERVGLHDDFFDLGGHSLLATRLVTRMAGAFGVEIPLRAVFEAPTVAGLARKVEEARAGSRKGQVPPIQPVSREGALPLSFAQERLWFLDRLEPDRALYNVPFALRLRGPVEAVALERGLREIVRRHEALRTTFPDTGGEPRQEVASFRAFPLPDVDLSALPEREREAEARRRLLEEGRRPFDLVLGPLLRVLLIRLGSDEALLLVNTHHIVSDGWSMGVLTGELAALYASSPLPELPVQYADFAVWQRRWLSGEVLERQIAYWRKELAGAPPLLELPTDRPRPARQSGRGGDRPVALTPELGRAVRSLARQEGATP